MKLTDLNRQGGIGANSLFLQIGTLNILVDAGLNPKTPGLGALPDFDLLRGVELDLIIITHCHLDHIGGLPVVMRQHPKTPVLLTQSHVDREDAAQFRERDEEAERGGQRSGLPVVHA